MSPLFDLLKKIKSGRTVYGLGLMSGTSADGADLALLEFSKKRKPKLVAAKTFSYPPGTRKKIQDFQQAPKISPEETILFSRFLGEVWADMVEKFLRKAKARRPDFVASHGQTIRHVPEFQLFLGKRLRGSHQAGEAEVLAKKLNTIVVSDFRAGDVALGGSGAPLMPFVHQYLFATPKKVRAILNIGGIANLTFLGKESFWAGDTGPGNCLADYLAQKFYGLSRDPGGKKAMRGRVSPELLAALKKNSFFARPFPKSTGKEDFPAEWLAGTLKRFRKMKKKDRLATVETLSAWGVAEALRKNAGEKLQEVCIAGGGAKNLFFLKQLQNYLPGVSFYPAGRLGWPADCLEAAGFAILGWWCLLGKRVGSAAVTGANRKGVLGKISQI
ncbi:MAG: anhydro-N-acetylmuramic acid kinase [candidate division Zixibacteria bacterium]|nr:anhydro-N-acetylmuramic acid kinase [candidate division Zixibacteria bacterium]